MCGQVNDLPHQTQSLNSENYIDGCAGIVSTDNFKNESDTRASISQELKLDCDKRKSSNKRFQLGSPPDDEIIRKNRNTKRQVDWHWINACIGTNFIIFV